MEQDTLGLHYTIAHPKDFGIKQKEATLPLYEKKQALKDYQNIKDYSDTLQTFDPQKLSVEERYTQNLLIDSLSTDLEGKQYFYLQEMFSPSGGIQIQYPILMAEYTFRCKEDIENYLALLKMTPEYFASYCDFTKEKVQKGFGMADFALEKVISQCKTVITSEEIENGSHFLVTTFDERLQKAIEEGIINEKEAGDYRLLNNEYLKNYVLKAYCDLGRTLETFMGSGQNDAGLCAFEPGKGYYAWLFKRTTGSDKPIDEVYKTLAQNYYNTMYQLRSNLISFQNTCSLTEAELSYFTLSDSDDILAHLTKQMEDDFPSVSATCTETGLTEGKHCSVCGPSQQPLKTSVRPWKNLRPRRIIWFRRLTTTRKTPSTSIGPWLRAVWNYIQPLPTKVTPATCTRLPITRFTAMPIVFRICAVLLTTAAMWKAGRCTSNSFRTNTLPTYWLKTPEKKTTAFYLTFINRSVAPPLPY